MEEQNIKKIPLDREWALGVFCHDRVEIAHYFYHWRYHLREQVKLALTAVGRFSVAFKENVQGLSTEMQNRFGSSWGGIANDRALEEVMDRLDRHRYIERVCYLSWTR
jgi:hypothetical protein